MYKLQRFFQEHIYNSPSYTRTGFGSMTYASIATLLMELYTHIPIDSLNQDQSKVIFATALYLVSIAASSQFDKIGSYVLSYLAAIKDWAFRKPDAFENARISVKSIYNEIKQGSFGDFVGYTFISLPFLILNHSDIYSAVFKNITEAPNFADSLVAALSLIGIAYVAGFFADIGGDVFDVLSYSIGKRLVEFHETYQSRKSKPSEYDKTSTKKENIENRGISIPIVKTDEPKKYDQEIKSLAIERIINSESTPIEIKQILSDNEIQNAFYEKTARNFVESLKNHGLNQDQIKKLLDLYTILNQ